MVWGHKGLRDDCTIPELLKVGEGGRAFCPRWGPLATPPYTTVPAHHPSLTHFVTLSPCLHSHSAFLKKNRPEKRMNASNSSKQRRLTARQCHPCNRTVFWWPSNCIYYRGGRVINGCMHREPPCLTLYMVSSHGEWKVRDESKREGKETPWMGDFSEWLLVDHITSVNAVLCPPDRPSRFRWRQSPQNDSLPISSVMEIVILRPIFFFYDGPTENVFVYSNSKQWLPILCLTESRMGN